MKLANKKQKSKTKKYRRDINQIFTVKNNRYFYVFFCWQPTLLLPVASFLP
jgi:hypothetical protein